MTTSDWNVDVHPNFENPKKTFRKKTFFTLHYDQKNTLNPLRCDVLERADTAVAKLQMSPLIVNGFRNGFHQWIQRIFLVVVEAKNVFSEKFFFGFRNMDALCLPVVGKPLVLEVLCFDMGTSVVSAVSAETIFGIMKCIADVDMRGRVRIGSKSEIFRFSILATPTIEIF